VLTDATGNHYEGGWENGEYHGKGVFTSASGGNKYEGGFENGEYHGKGVFTFADGNKYEGGWENGKQHGQGVITSTDGAKHEVVFKNGKPFLVEKKWVHKVCTYFADSVKQWKFLGSWHGW
jgi:hypothetical protein